MDYNPEHGQDNGHDHGRVQWTLFMAAVRDMVMVMFIFMVALLNKSLCFWKLIFVMVIVSVLSMTNFMVMVNISVLHMLDFFQKYTYVMVMFIVLLIVMPSLWIWINLCWICFGIEIGAVIVFGTVVVLGTFWIWAFVYQ